MQYDIMSMMRVFNEMNETNLEYIEILGLFGRYNVEIPFDKQVNILIGENGLGKTTILNCIYYILEKKFSELVNIQFSEIKIKFRNDNKVYHISIADIREYGRERGRRTLRYVDEREIYSIYDVIENMAMHYVGLNFEENMMETVEILAHEIARKFDISPRMARNQVMHYFDERKMMGKDQRKGKGSNVVDLSKAITENVSHRIIYLPTYRRIEDDFASLNLRNEELNNSELLIRFGMSDVQNSIDRILESIRSLAMQGFTEMTSVLLKQYTEGENPIKDTVSKRLSRIDSEIVKIVLDRLGKEVEKKHKKKILHLVESGEIWHDDYLYLCNFLNKLIDNYDLQKAYDDRIKKFADTCNRYLIDKHFEYNQSMLNLDIYLNEKINGKKNTIPLTQLSSGEKQIVSLFSKLYLESDEKSIVIIDEPELSLSLEWQKMLLPDIMRTENCDLLVTVTHSPFIFENEFDYDAKEIRKYITMCKRG